jgi:hypothetical protein
LDVLVRIVQLFFLEIVDGVEINVSVLVKGLIFSSWIDGQIEDIVLSVIRFFIHLYHEGIGPQGDLCILR